MSAHQSLSYPHARFHHRPVGPQHRDGTPLYNPAGHVVGRLYVATAGARLVKSVRPEHHKTRPPGWAIATEHLEALRREGGSAGRIELRHSNGFALLATVASFDGHGLAIRQGGHEAQVLLPDTFWTGWPPTPPTPTQRTLRLSL